MNIIVREHVNAIASPEENIYEISFDEVGNANVIPVLVGLQKGDILVYAGPGDVRRLEVGPDGSVLTADSTSELGVKWATP